MRGKRAVVAGLVVSLVGAGLILPAQADLPDWLVGWLAHVAKMRVFKDFATQTQISPPVIPKLSSDIDSSGLVNTFQPNGPTFPPTNAFFQNLASTNQRTCFSCHMGLNGWSINDTAVQARFALTQGLAPIFRLIDGATCPNKDVSTLAARQDAFKLLTSKGLIRIALPVPITNLQFSVAVVNDPYNCTSNPVTGLTSPTAGIISMYRRPLPSTNLKFLTEVMWDGRETQADLTAALSRQGVDATLGHAEATSSPGTDQQGQIVAFETGIFTAQSADKNALVLSDLNATGGPVALSQLSPGAATPVFDLYAAWANLTGTDGTTQARLSIARGEALFNASNCAGCHNSHNVGTHATPGFFKDLGIAAANPPPPVLDTASLPVFSVTCTATGQTVTVTDIGRAMITGQCADIGKFKVPSLRGLASRAPYFHNGGAATLNDVVNFYVAHFNLNFTEQQKTDLVNFLSAL